MGIEKDSMAYMYAMESMECMKTFQGILWMWMLRVRNPSATPPYTEKRPLFRGLFPYMGVLATLIISRYLNVTQM
jgi:hypothetical protein